jgi:hypothetical protein
LNSTSINAAIWYCFREHGSHAQGCGSGGICPIQKYTAIYKLSFNWLHAVEGSVGYQADSQSARSCLEYQSMMDSGLRHAAKMSVLSTISVLTSTYDETSRQHTKCR